MTRPILLIIIVTFLLVHPYYTVAYPRPFSFARSVTMIEDYKARRDINTVNTKLLFWKKPQEKKVPEATIRKKLYQAVQGLVEGAVRKGPRIMHHTLYWLTAYNALQSVRLNEYTSLHITPSDDDTPKNYFNTFNPVGVKGQLVSEVYSRLFYFARLRPRLLYSVGALLRALQLCTPLQTILDPSAGVGAGVNVCAMVAGSRWVQPAILGWATTKWIWVWLGARKVKGTYLPITVSISKSK